MKNTQHPFRITALASIVAVTLTTQTHALQLDPIATSGHDRDIIAELGLNIGDVATTSEIGSRHFYENGMQASQPTNPKPGLTQSITGFVSGTTGNTIDFDFQPFSQNNVLKFDTTLTSTRSLTFTTPAGYSQLALVFSGGSLSASIANLSYTINYDGGGTQTGIINVPDWGVATKPAGIDTLINAGRINMGTGTWNNQIPEGDTTLTRWSVYLAEITPNSTANINSVDFGSITLNGGPGGLTGSSDVVVFGLSGAAVPEPSVGALAGCALLSLVWRLRRRDH